MKETNNYYNKLMIYNSNYKILRQIINNWKKITIDCKRRMKILKINVLYSLQKLIE